MDEKLILLLKNCEINDRKSQEELYKYCYEPMMRVCNKYVAYENLSDVYNKAMLKIFTKLNQYSQDASFLAWARKIMVNTCLDFLRQEKQIDFKEIEHYEEEINISYSEVYTKLEPEPLLKLIDLLPKQSALVFRLFALDGYKHQEIALALNISEGTSKWHLNSARKELQRLLQNNIKNNKNLNYAG